MNSIRPLAGVVAAGLMLGMGSGCASLGGAGREAHARPVDARRIAKLLPRDGWYSPNRQALIQWLESQANRDPSAPPPVAVFDWDNTCVFGDVEETFFNFALEYGGFYPTAEELARLTPDSINGITESKDGVRFADAGAAIRATYAELQKYRDDPPGAGSLAKLTLRLEFATRVGWLYTAFADTPGIGEDYAYRWITYWLGGMTSAEVGRVASVAFRERPPTEIRHQVWMAQPRPPAGQCQYETMEGLRAQPQMQALMRAMQAAGVQVYVVSASAEPIVEAAAEALGYPVDADHIFGVRLKMKDGKYLPELVDAAEYPFTYREGKVEAIRKVIKAAPVFVAGDSDGDYAMLTAFDSLQMRLVINRNKKSAIRKLYDDALKPAGGAPWPRTLLQGRDENTGAFRAGMETVPLGKTEPTALRE